MQPMKRAAQLRLMGYLLLCYFGLTAAEILLLARLSGEMKHIIKGISHGKKNVDAPNRSA
jgi:hypothetical protein